MPRISIIIPICNTEQYLEECIESVIAQSLQDIEVICVDDGSTDRSLQIMQDFSLKDNRIKVISKANAGYGNSVNIGIQAAKGQYIGIVESDDFISNQMYETLWNMSDGGTVDVIKGNFWDYYDWKDKRPEAVVNIERKDMPEVKEAFSIRQYPYLLWGHPSIWSGIYRLDFLKENKITFIEAPGGGWVDNPFFFETLCLAKKIKWTKEPLYFYRKTNMNSSSNNQSDLTLPLRRMQDNLNVLKKYNYNDEDILGFAYARALMYMHGVTQEKHYYKQIDHILPYAHKLMEQMNYDIIHHNFHLGDQINFNKYLSPLKLLGPISGKLLIYNWVPFDNPGKIGGGVTIYCQNLISVILKERPDIQVYFLSSGWAYDASTTACYIRKIPNVFGDRCRSFEVVNSPVPAAQDLLLNNPQIALKSDVLKAIISSFLSDYGPFDVIHFNNLEGLSLDILELKSDFPRIKFVYSIHNYVPFCVTGFYFQRNRNHNCSPAHSAAECLSCTTVGRRKNISGELYERAKLAVHAEKQFPMREWITALNFDSLDSIGDSETLISFTQTAIKNINNYVDHVLAVSKRVYDIALDNGIQQEKMQVAYIGTRIADNQVRCSIAPPSKYMKIAFLGSNAYFEEKGFPFLIEALSTLEEKDAARIDVLLTTTNGNISEIRQRLSKFHNVIVKKGYLHSELKCLLKDVHLGIIPVLWEDNLPQIAIEMVAIGVPILCSSFGGASELCNNKLFCFQGGDKEDFKEHLLYFLNNPRMLSEYWKEHSGLMTLKQHWSEMEKVFSIPRAGEITIDLNQYSQLLQENDFLYKNISSGNMLEVQRCRQELEDVRASVSFRVGRIITFFPRKIRGGLRCYREHGAIYTIKRTIQHLSKKA